MKRRHFIQKSLISIILLKLFPSFKKDNEIKDRNKIRFFTETGQQNDVDGFIEENQQYISLSQLSQVMAERDFFNEDRLKLVMFKNNQRITFTANNTFIKIDSNFYQVAFPVLYKDSEFWMDIEEFVKIMSSYSTIKLYYGKNDLSLSYENKGYTITGVDVAKRDNGILITVRTTKKFPKKHVIVANKNGRLHLTIFNGLLNELTYDAYPSISIVKKIQGIQLKKTAELVFTVTGKLKKDSFSIVNNTINDDILLVVNTRLSSTEKKEIEEKEKVLAEAEEEAVLSNTVDTIVIDPGHGGVDPGAIGYLSKRKRLYEKTVVLDVGLKIKKLLNKKVPNVNIIMTRNKDQTIKLFQRGTIANKNKGKLFISLHCNGNRSSRANGFETYVLGTHKDEAARQVALAENEVIKYEDQDTTSSYTGLNLIRATMAQSAYKKESIYLARIIDNKVGSHMKTLSIKNRGVKSAGFAVLFKPSMPSVLVEVAFITNKHEVKVLARKNDRSRIAESIAGGVIQYIKDVQALNG